ncbi:signal peptidase complex subunit 1 isoform X3 [Eptesicus fuscus]|uniref:signal peptidase complex subunit 1 isoform X3 n=1 Tax=Eptesicus fuscus TaxID=29078 RepID=UPI0024040C3A|nr:signal peptidase complex subunit 1 isoform X3 [Eptesicus fuscus]
MERGGASGRPGLCETSASGAAAIALPGSIGSPSRARDRSPNCTVPEPQRPSPRSRTPSPRCRTPSPRCRTPALCCPPPQPVMLEHLSSLPMQMDYKGQKLAEQMFQGIILFSALTLPPWPIYRRHPLKWLPVQDSGTEDKKPGERKVKRHAKNN